MPPISSFLQFVLPSKVEEMENPESRDIITMLPLLFENTEVETIKKSLQALRSSLYTGKKKDYDKYCRYNLELLQKVKIRAQKQRLNPTNSSLIELQEAMRDKVNNLMLKFMQRFPNEISYVFTYIRFCKQYGLLKLAKRKLKCMLEEYGKSSPKLYELGIWGYSLCDAREEALKCISQGILIHDNHSLYKTAFKFLLDVVKTRRNHIVEKGLQIDPNDNTLTSKKAEIFFSYLRTRTLITLELARDFLIICWLYDFTNDLSKAILDHVQRHFSSDEMTYDILADWEIHSSMNQPLKRKEIIKIVEIYKNALKHLNTEKMWYLYLDRMKHIYFNTTFLPKFKRILLCTALYEAQEKMMTLNEKYYVLWFHMLLERKKYNELIGVAQTATERQPLSVKIWEAYLYCLLKKEKMDQAREVFQKGVEKLGKDSLPLWLLLLKYQMVNDPEKVVKIFNQAWTQPIEISGVLRPMYLERLEIKTARKKYRVRCQQQPYSLEMHKTMIKLEANQLVVDLSAIRFAYTSACSQFGNSETSVWIDYIKFELKTEPRLIRPIYENAVRQLPKYLHETFFLELQLLNLADEIFQEEPIEIVEME